MKKVFFTLAAALCLAFTANSAVLTVSNNSGNPGQYTSFTAAQTAASSGDTIYLHGSDISYGNFTMSKPLTIIGAGALPNKSYKWRTTTGVITINYSAAGSRFYGLNADQLYFTYGGSGNSYLAGDIIVERCRINNLFLYSASNGASNWLIRNNVINIISVNYGQTRMDNSIVQNNLIGSIGNTSYQLGDANYGSWILSNNIISGTIYVKRALVVNNIFYNASAATIFIGPQTASCDITSNCFKNNGVGITLANIIFGNNTGSSNLLNQDPLFEYAPGNAVNTVYNYSYTSGGPYVNFNLKTGSPCILAGSDGTDMGIYGSLTPFVEQYSTTDMYRYYPTPSIPMMTNMTIYNSSVIQNGQLNVDFKARKID